ncbi:phosphate-starvation-inducible PsiE family protein [Roseospira navarrensis]|uniref:Uncharacterized protein n=1 Tax=Roseospira navarrensis TaxID=140058 RepID=A0A7X2D4T4_9PROT|nr:phosphate-starvation-inducible PsiE family protein [Roseospira navarrensis]MQX38258.1 hypothetical protein [Roseospira navarrensis]
MFASGPIGLPDLFLVLIYLEAIGMIYFYYSDRRPGFVYPPFIAITALMRLFILRRKKTVPASLLFEAVGILLPSVSAVVLVRVSRV